MAVRCLQVADVFAATHFAARALGRFTPIASLVYGLGAKSVPSGAMIRARGYKFVRAIEIPCAITSVTSPGGCALLYETAIARTFALIRCTSKHSTRSPITSTPAGESSSTAEVKRRMTVRAHVHYLEMART